MFSKTPLQKLSLGAAGAIWLALGSVESANAASFKSSIPSSISQTPGLAINGLGDGKATTKSSDDVGGQLLGATVSFFVVISVLDPLLEFIGSPSSDGPSDDEGEPEIFNNGPNATFSSPPPPIPVPTPALLPGLIGLGLKMMHKRRSEQSGASAEA